MLIRRSSTIRRGRRVEGIPPVRQSSSSTFWLGNAGIPDGAMFPRLILLAPPNMYTRLARWMGMFEKHVNQISGPLHSGLRKIWWLQIFTWHPCNLDVGSLWSMRYANTP